MSVIRAMVVLHSTSGFARDDRVNTFHFNGLISDANLNTITLRLRDLYETNHPDGSAPVGKFLANHLDSYDVKLYDVTDEPSGPPIAASLDNTLPARTSAVDMPSEVALCLSYQGTPEAGLIQTRRRGRVYFGPFNESARAIAASPSRPHLDLPAQLIKGAKRLAVGVDAAAEWVVYSRPYAGRGEVVRPGRTTLPAIAARAGTTVNIDEVWCDDAWDTQRRRGERPLNKTIVPTGE